MCPRANFQNPANGWNSPTPSGVLPGVPLPGQATASVTRDGAAVAVTVRGEFDLATVGVLDEALHQACDGHCDRVLLDLSGVDFFDVVAMRTVAESWVTLRQRGGGLRVSGARPAVRRLFALAGLRELLD